MELNRYMDVTRQGFCHSPTPLDAEFAFELSFQMSKTGSLTNAITRVTRALIHKWPVLIGKYMIL